MRRSRRNRELLTVSLFPFLAVLICTLGVLILMLVMVAKNADVEAREVREDKKEKQLADITTLDAKLNTRLVQVEGLNQVRPEATERLSKIRNHRGHLEDEIRKLDQLAVQLAAQLKQVDSESGETEEDPIRAAEIQSLEAQIALANTELDQVRKVATEFQPVAYSIVPQPGANGTHRRPIYLECDDQGVTLQPFGIVLNNTDFVEPVVTGNPLDAALLAIREYWNKYDLAGEHGNPYPLLIIRPSGAQSYVTTRRAMKSWDDEFGYEIVEADKTLDFGENDPQLQKEIEVAIANAKRRQATMIAAAIEQRARLRTSFQGASQQRPGLVASGPRGGFVSTGSQQQAGDRLARLSVTSANEESQSPMKQEFGSVLDSYRTSGKTGPKKKSRSETPVNHQSTVQTTGTGEGNFALSSPKQSLAAERGKGWALPSQSPGATGYLRPIRIFCRAEQLAVRSATDRLTTIEMTGTTEEAVEDLIDSVWQLIDGWGSAGQNGYWKPELRITVLPSGRKRFNELQILLNQSGLEIKESAQ